MNKLVLGLTTAVAAVMVAAPVANAQVAPGTVTPIVSPSQPSTPLPVVPPAQPSTPLPVIPPAQPGVPTNLTPEGAAVHIDNFRVAHSRHGYTYAVAPVVAKGVPYNTDVTVHYTSRLKTFKPRTAGSWRSQSGTLTLSSKGTPGLQPGQTTDVIGHLKFAFKGKTEAQVKKDLLIWIETGSGDYITQPISGAQG